MRLSAGPLPRHVAIIMDGNGRWAKLQGLPRSLGHERGRETVRMVVSECIKKGIETLTLFAFSSENWRRPTQEVTFLMRLLRVALQQEIGSLHKNGVCLKVIGEKAALPVLLQESIQTAENLTQNNQTLHLNLAINYGGRWDIVQAARSIAQKAVEHQLDVNDITEAYFNQHLAMADLPAPDLFIRTSGEERLSNFLLWQLAYTELYFTDVFWPDFKEQDFQLALEAYAKRKRRFGHSAEVAMAEEALVLG